MTAVSSPRRTAPHRGAARLDGEAGRIAPAELLAFAESLVREAGAAAPVAGAAVHILGPGRSCRVTGEALCLGGAVWRVSVVDETGEALAEITLTMAQDAAPPRVVPIEPRRGSEAADRRTRIALAARDVFAEKGYTAATMREIAAAAGMHVPTMYQYVRSKEEILELVYAWTIDQAIDGMEAVLDAEGQADRRMDAIVRRLHDVNAALRRGTLVMNRETRSLNRAARDRVLGRYAGMVRRIGDVIAEGQAQGSFRAADPQLAAVFVDALADVWVLRPFAVGNADPKAYAAELAAFVRGALAQPAAGPREPQKPSKTDRME
jgi:AcrR family transcriptional regulator